VQVSADVDMNQVTTQEEKFDPDGQVVRSEQTGEENSRENSTSSSGASSATANIPGAGAGAGAGASDTGNATGRNESTTNYEISKTVRTEVRAPGTIKRLSVAVAVDGINAPAVKGKPGAYTPRTAEEMKRLDDLVKAAIGFSADRGDVVSVVNVRFPHVEGEGGVTAASPLAGFDKNDIMRAVEVGVLAVVAILILFFVVRPLVRGVGSGGGGLPMLAGGGGVPVTRLVTTPDGQVVQAQVDPATGQPLALPAPETDPRINIRLAARYLRDLQVLFPKRLELAIASYNAGERAVQKYNNQIPPYPETRNYVQLVAQFYQLYQPGGSAGNRTGDTDKPRRVEIILPGRRSMPPPASVE